MDFKKIQEEFLEIYYELAYGFQSKYQQYNRNRNNQEDGGLNKQTECFQRKYVRNDYLVHALNRFVAFAVRCNMLDDEGKIIAPNNETDAIENWFNLVVGEWLTKWHGDLSSALSIYSELDPLINYSDGIFIPTTACEEYAGECLRYNQDSEQLRLFKLIYGLSQKGYVYCRKFFILHKVASTIELLEFREKLSDMGVEYSLIEKIVEAAYEYIPNDCLYECKCGWTVSRNEQEIYTCIHERCRKETNNFTNLKLLKDKVMMKRLRRGVMRYLALPGELEIKIEKYCDKKEGLIVELWPEKDTYDIKVSLPNKKEYIIDAKDYSSPFALGQHLLKDNKLIWQKNESNQVFIVVPDEVEDLKKDFTLVVNKIIAEEYGSIKCITFRELTTLLEKELANE